MKLVTTANRCNRNNKRNWSNWSLTSLGHDFPYPVKINETGHWNRRETYRQNNLKPKLATKLVTTVIHYIEKGCKNWSNWSLTSLGQDFPCAVKTYKTGRWIRRETHTQNNLKPKAGLS